MKPFRIALIAAIPLLGAHLFAAPGLVDGWQPTDDAGAAVARVRLFFHFVECSDQKNPQPASPAENNPALEPYVQNTVAGLEYAVPGQPRQFLGGLNSRFHSTGIQFEVAGIDVVLVPRQAAEGQLPRPAALR